MLAFNDERMAADYAARGGQALFIMADGPGRMAAPEPVRRPRSSGRSYGPVRNRYLELARSVGRGMRAKLFDQDRDRLLKTCVELNAACAAVNGEKSRWQHVRLNGFAVERAKRRCDEQ